MEEMKHFVDTGTTVRVSVTDGRVFTGTLGCVDKQLNEEEEQKRRKREGKERKRREGRREQQKR